MILGYPKTKRLRHPKRKLQPGLERLQERLRRSGQGILAGQRKHLHVDQQRRILVESGTRRFRRQQTVSKDFFLFNYYYYILVFFFRFEIFLKTEMLRSFLEASYNVAALHRVL